MALALSKTFLAAVTIICIASVITRPSLADEVLFTSTQVSYEPTFPSCNGLQQPSELRHGRHALHFVAKWHAYTFARAFRTAPT